MQERQDLHQGLAQDIESNQAGHAYLFSGEKAREQALLFAMALNCVNLHLGKPCCECTSCRKISEGIFPDVHIITPLNGQLRIDQMRKMQERAILKPFLSSIQIFILEGVDTLKDAAANSLLKILEEPPSETYFILTTNNSDKILPTIISRARNYYFGGGEAFNIDWGAIEDNLKHAREFLDYLPRTDELKLLLFSKNYDKDKDGLLYFLLALLKVLELRLKRKEDNVFSQSLTLKAALFTERTIILLKQNVNHRLLADVFFLRLRRILVV